MVRSLFCIPHPAIFGRIPGRPGLSLSDHFALIIDGLCGAVAARASGNRVAAPLLVLLWGRLRRMVARLARLVERAAGGTMPVRRSRGPRAARPAQVGPRLPSGYGWLVRLVPEAASYGSQLQHLLSQPEMAALIAAAPHAGRMFGPLARMLAADPGAKPQRQARVPGLAPAPVAAVPHPAFDASEIPVSGFLASGVPYWARHAWPGHDYAGREPPGRLKPVVDRSD